MSQDQISTHVLPMSERHARPGARKTTAADPKESFTLNLPMAKARGF